MKKKMIINTSMDENSEVNVLKGMSSDEINGLYIDRSNDSYPNNPSPTGDKSNVISYPKCKRNRWYINDVLDFEYDTTKDGGKEKFLKNHKSLFANVIYQYNLWNSYKKWTFSGGKNVKTNPVSQTTEIKLTGNDNVTIAFEFYDSHHDKNERVRICYKETWDGNVLKMFIEYQCRVHWAKGSKIKHACFVISLLSIYYMPENGEFGFDVVRDANSGLDTSMEGSFKVNLLHLEQWFDQVISDHTKKEKIALFGNVGWIGLGNNDDGPVEGYYVAMWFPNSLYVEDATKRLNGLIDHMGDLEFVVEGDSVKLVYTSTDGRQDETTTSNMDGIATAKINWNGAMTIPYLYKK